MTKELPLLPETSDIEDLQVTVDVQLPPPSSLAIRLRGIWTYLSIAQDNIKRDAGQPSPQIVDVMNELAAMIREAEQQVSPNVPDCGQSWREDHGRHVTQPPPVDGHVFAPLARDIGNCTTCGRAIVDHVLMPAWPQVIATDEGEPQGPGRATPADFEGGDGSADPGGISRTPGAATAVLRQAVAYAEANLGSPRAALIRMVDAARITLAAAPLVAVPGHDPDLFPCPAWLDDACPTCAWVDQERIAADLDLDAMEKAIYGGHGVPPTEALTHIAFTRSLLAARPAPVTAAPTEGEA